MTRIQKLIIENFQSHVNTTIEFNNGLNVISGPSDNGKSAVIRALKWILFNEPRGTEFIREGTSTARVTVVLSNGFSIVRERSKSKNRYTVINPDDTTQVFEGFGNEVPLEVIDKHGIVKIALDSDMSAILNIGDQLEAPFMLSETASVRAKAIGRLTGLHIMDRAIRDSISDLRKYYQLSSKMEEDINEINEKLKKYDDLKVIAKKLDNLDNIYEQLSANTGNINKLRSLKATKLRLEDELTSISYTINSLVNIPGCENHISILKKRFERFKLYINFKKNLSSINSEIKECKDSLGKSRQVDFIAEIFENIKGRASVLERYLKGFKNLRSVNFEIDNTNEIISDFKGLKSYEKIIGELEEKYDAHTKLNKYLEIFNKLDGQIKEGIKFIKDNSSETDKLLDEYLAVLKEMPRCPLCDSEIDQKKINDILNNYKEAVY